MIRTVALTAERQAQARAVTARTGESLVDAMRIAGVLATYDRRGRMTLSATAASDVDTLA